VQIGPYLTNGAADHSPRDLTEPGTIKIPQIDNVGGHRDILAPAVRLAGCANLPAFFVSDGFGLLHFVVARIVPIGATDLPVVAANVLAHP